VSDTLTLEAILEETPPNRSLALLCAGLLAAGRPLLTKDISKLLGLKSQGVEQAIEELQQALYRADLGLIIEEVAGGYRLVVDPSLVPDLADLLSPPPLPHLSTAALETLAVIAYKQPVTRGEVEVARGISCVSTLETLQERELVKVVGHRDVVGQPLLYGTTERFLLEFGLKSLNDLPPISDSPSEFLRG
jgi:segregation and condensation protein B